MPKTASKRAKARQTARVTRAHQTTRVQPVTRKVPAARRRQRPRGFAYFVGRYPWASTIFTALLVGGFLLVLYTNHLGPWAPPPPKQASCNLKTHVCDKPSDTHLLIDKSKIYIATIKTAKGNIVLELDPKIAPITVNNFVYLARQGFYNGLTFHRVLQLGQPAAETQGKPSSVGIIQGGDPKGDGSGSAGYKFKDEPVVGDYTAGAVAMANSGPNTNGSQFFICTADDTKAFAKSYNLFGHVISGLDVAQKIQVGDKMISVTIQAETPTPTPKPTQAPATPTAVKPTATPAK
jgi:cyclophilin family peptidyl-prolyl cis-trans isomerase